MQNEYLLRLRCVICGCDDQFESNEDNSYIKCTFCNKEYFGGIEELKECNQDAFNEVKEEIQKDASAYIEERLKNAFKGCKYIKIK